MMFRVAWGKKENNHDVEDKPKRRSEPSLRATLILWRKSRKLSKMFFSSWNH